MGADQSMTGSAGPFVDDARTLRLDLGGTWSLWFDDAAPWAEAELHPPGTAVANIAPAPPTGGWDMLARGIEQTVPATTACLRPGWHGVSWWSREIRLPSCRGARLRFEGARLLAEIYLDGRLIGWDLEGYTPFEVAIPPSLATPGPHRLDVRITNPGGSDTWDDVRPVDWGGQLLPASQDFGGLWLPVSLAIDHGARIDDLWVRFASCGRRVLVDAEIEAAFAGALHLHLVSPDGRTLGEARLDVVPGHHVLRHAFEAGSPLPYGPGHPHRYSVEAMLVAGGASDRRIQTFGFRLMEALPDGFRTDGRPRFLCSAISWGRYAQDVVASPDELVREARAAAQFGFAALTAHRRCAHPGLLDALEAEGLFLIQEPGGVPSLRADLHVARWREDPGAGLMLPLMTERVRRLARRDRSRACLLLWILGNEVVDLVDADPGTPARALLGALRQVDDSRPAMWTSSWTTTPFQTAEGAPSRAFDFHEVNNYPSFWSAQAEAEIAALAAPAGMVAYAGESHCMCSLAGLYPPPPPGSGPEADLAAARARALETALAEVDPETCAGGPDALASATARLLSFSTAQLIRHHRANERVSGLAINGWHAHPRIGQVGLLRLDRTPIADAATLKAALQPVQILVAGLPGSLRCGRHEVALWLLDDASEIAPATELVLTLTLIDPAGSEHRHELVRPAPGGRVQPLGTLALALDRPGTWTVAVAGTAGTWSLCHELSVLAVDPVAVAGCAIAVHDPSGTLAPRLAALGVRTRQWRMFDPGPVLVEAGNLRLLHTLFAGPARRAVVLLRPGDRRGRGSEAGLGELVPLGFAADDRTAPAPAAMTGDWVGGWSFTCRPEVLPSLGGAGLWDHRHADLHPQQFLRGLKARTVTGAVAFADAAIWSPAGTPVAGASTAILHREGHAVLLSTLPVAADRPLASAVLADMIAWALAEHRP